jgi:uncharacterized membrane protein (DUF485 family)
MHSKTMDYYNDYNSFFKKLCSKSNVMTLLTAIFTLYNFFAYPLIIAFKWHLYSNAFLLIMELLTLVIYGLKLTLLILKYKRL